MSNWEKNTPMRYRVKSSVDYLLVKISRALKIERGQGGLFLACSDTEHSVGRADHESNSAHVLVFFFFFC